jgi:hypothetical protein
MRSPRWRWPRVPTSAQALCAAQRVREGLALLDGPAAARTRDQYRYSPEIARLQAVRGLCQLAAGDRAQAAEMERLARATFEGQPGVAAAWRRPLDRLAAGLRARTTGLSPARAPASRT